MNQDPELLRCLLRARDRMAAAPEEDWPVRRIAEVSGVSRAHFARSFKQAFGVPPQRGALDLQRRCRGQRGVAALAGDPARAAGG